MNDLSLMYFRQDSCAPCDARKPIAKMIADATGLPLVLVDIKDPRNAELVETFQVRATPTLALANHEGRLVAWTGNLIGGHCIKVLTRYLERA